MVLSSYICGILLVELKLLLVICNRNVVLELKREKKLTYSNGKKPPCFWPAAKASHISGRRNCL